MAARIIRKLVDLLDVNASGLANGDVPTWNSGTSRFTMEPSGGGGGSAGAPTVSYFSFAYNTANLASGVAFYTPTVGDVFVDAWIEITTAWNGTTPHADFGTDVGYMVAAGANAYDMTTADSAAAVAGLIVNGSGGTMESAAINAGNIGRRWAPGRFTATTPWKVWVTQDGAKGGAAPGGSAGTARVYIVTATPVAL